MADSFRFEGRHGERLVLNRAHRLRMAADVHLGEPGEGSVSGASSTPRTR